MGRLEAIVLLIIAAPAYGAVLSHLVQRLSRSGPAPAVDAGCPVADRAPLAREAWISARLSSGFGHRTGAIGFAEVAPIALGAAGIALWSLFADAPTVLSAVLGWALLVLSLIDWRHLLLPDVLTLPLLVLGLAVGAFLGSWPDHVIGAAAGAVSLMIVGSAFGWISGKEGLGLGDVKLFAAGGAWTGWQALPGTLLVAALLGLACGVLSGRLGEGRGQPIAFGPFLAAGIWISWLYGPLSL